MSLLSRFMGGNAASPATPVPAAARIEPPLQAPVAMSGTARPDPTLFNVGWSGGQSRVKTLPPVTPIIAQRHATVFACCNNIAGDHCKLPLEVWQRGKDGREVIVKDHPATYLLNVEASSGVPASVSRFALFYAFTLRGKAYAWCPRDGGGELEMIDTLDPDKVSELTTAGRARFYQFADGDDVQRRATNRSMMHLRYMAHDGWTGRSPIQVAAESVGLALAGQEAAARSASGNFLRGYIKMSDVFEDDETYERNKARLKAALRDPDGEGLPILGAEDAIERLDLSASDMELLSSRKFDREQIAAIYRMPPSKLQMLEHGVKANGQQQAIDYRGECLAHWGGLAEGFMAQAIFSEGERRAGLFLRHNYDALLTATTKERYEAGRMAVGGPWMSWQEFRRIEGLPDMPQDERPYPPPNMTEKPGASDGAKEKEGAA
jgi:HK97 family phage portal protein